LLTKYTKYNVWRLAVRYVIYIYIYIYIYRNDISRLRGNVPAYGSGCPEQTQRIEVEVAHANPDK
jgi:hypothetical protein